MEEIETASEKRTSQGRFEARGKMRVRALLAVMLAADVFCRACGAQEMSAPASIRAFDVRQSLSDVKGLLENAPSEARQPSFELTVAVSLSLHPDYLADLARAVDRVGGRLVVRGVGVEDKTNAKQPHAFFSLAKDRQAALRANTAGAFKELAERTAPAGALIDPVFFRRHDVQAVPVFAVGWTKDDNGVATRRTALVRGQLTVDAALETLAREAADMDVSGSERRRLADWALEKASELQGWVR